MRRTPSLTAATLLGAVLLTAPTAVAVGDDVVCVSPTMARIEIGSGEGDDVER